MRWAQPQDRQGPDYHRLSRVRGLAVASPARITRPTKWVGWVGRRLGPGSHHAAQLGDGGGRHMQAVGAHVRDEALAPPAALVQRPPTESVRSVGHRV